MENELRLKRSNHGVVDRLSDLPDELVTLILDNLPTKDVALANLTSTKFRSAFSALKNLDFDDFPISHCLQYPLLVERTPNFKKFVDYALRSCQSENLGRFTLRFGRFCGDIKRPLLFQDIVCEGRCYPELEPTRLNAWISFPLARRFRELDLCLNVKISPECCMLPSSIFICETLEILKLDSNLDLGVHDVKAFPIHLPRLKLLHLRSLFFKQDEFVTKLVKSCPLLEDLLLECWWDCGDVLLISSPSLLKLDLDINKCEEYKHSSCVTIQTPNLQCFKYCDLLAEHYSIQDMPALVQAEISIVIELEKPKACRNLCGILKSCSTVSHLHLLNNFGSCLDCVELKDLLPVFPNLKYLELGDGEIFWDKVLVQFLECSPSLTTLAFPKGICYSSTSLSTWEQEGRELERQCWRTTRAILSCCKYYLKNIVVKEFLGSQRELALIQFLLDKAIVLESLDIWLTDDIEDLLVDQSSLKNALQEMPKASGLCSIRVLEPS